MASLESLKSSESNHDWLVDMSADVFSIGDKGM